MSMA
jgi:splicing factor U2AF subunit